MEIALERQSVGSLKGAIARYVSMTTGLQNVSIKFNGWILEIRCEFGELLIYDLKNFKELFGKIKNLRFEIQDMVAIRRAVSILICRLRQIMGKK